MSDDCFDESPETDSGSRADGRGESVEFDGGRTTLEEVLEVLTHPTRRLLLYYLQHHEVATVEELAIAVVSQTTNAPADEVPTDHREDVETNLIHNHLPHLAAANCIEYDDRSRTVRYSDPPVLLDAVLRLLAQLEAELDE